MEFPARQSQKLTRPYIGDWGEVGSEPKNLLIDSIKILHKYRMNQAILLHLEDGLMSKFQ